MISLISQLNNTNAVAAKLNSLFSEPAANGSANNSHTQNMNTNTRTSNGINTDNLNIAHRDQQQLLEMLINSNNNNNNNIQCTSSFPPSNTNLSINSQPIHRYKPPNHFESVPSISSIASIPTTATATITTIPANFLTPNQYSVLLNLTLPKHQFKYR